MILDDSKRYDVIRPLEDGKTDWVIGCNLCATDAANLHSFHKPMDRKYAHGVTIRESRAALAKACAL